MKYEDNANRFLRERCLGIWHPHRRDATAYGKITLLSANSALAWANDLKVFLTYLERTRRDWRSISYIELLESFDRDMLSGRIRQRGEKHTALSPNTINRRMSVAIEYLQWAGDRGLRQPFEVLTTLAAGQRGRYRRGRRAPAERPVEVRIGIHRQKPTRLRLPSMAEIEKWLAELRRTQGRSKWLAARFILETGCRAEETALFREQQLPDVAQFHLDQPARMEICFGTKGERDPIDPERRGKPRTLRFRRSFCAELNNYRSLGRKSNLSRFRDRYPGRELPSEFFLDDITGRPLSKQAIYRAWTRAEYSPFPGWSPHLGRHTFACNTILLLLDEEAKLIRQTLATLPRSHLISRTENLIDTYLRPILGHADVATTQLYIDWISDHILLPSHRIAWSNYLDGL